MDEEVMELIKILNNKNNIVNNITSNTVNNNNTINIKIVNKNSVVSRKKGKNKTIFKIKNNKKPYINDKEFDLNTSIPKKNKYNTTPGNLAEDSRRWNSKHMIFQTFNKYINNPKAFESKFQLEILKLYNYYNSNDKILSLFLPNNPVLNNNTLRFRIFNGNLNDNITPEDKGYFYKCISMPNIVEKTLKDNGFLETNSNKQFTIFWNNSSIKPEIYANLKGYQKINHHPKSVEICRKDYMCKNISKMMLKFGNSFNIIPKTFILPNDLSLISKYFEKNKLSYSKRKVYAIILFIK